MSIRLRPYQTEAVGAVRGAWARGLQRPAIVLPTGAGKTVVFSDIIATDKHVNPSERALVLVHRDELINQAVNKLRAVMPEYRVGIVKGERDEVGADAVVGTVQTLRHESRRDRLRHVGLIVVDECHHATAPSYRAVLDHYPAARVLGVTATMSRSDGDALGAIWQEVVYRRGIGEMISDGYLVAPRGITVKVDDLDLEGVKRSRGDYQDGALGRALSESMAPARIVEAWTEHAAGKQTILFAPTVAFAEIMAEEFAAAGVAAEVVHGKQAVDDRRAVLERFVEGKTTVICNCMVLTEGTDLPIAEVAVIARPTTHKGLYVQMVGRVLRPYPGKTGALVLDVAGAARRHSLNAEIDLEGTEPREMVEKLEDDDLDETVEDDIILDGAGFASEFGMLYRDGKLVVEHVDLFHNSGAAWNRTYDGTWFLDAGTKDEGRYIALVQRGAEWSVVEISRRPGGETTRGTRGSVWLAVGIPDLGYAMATAEGEVTWRERQLASKTSSWRAKPVSGPQHDMIRRFGLVLPADARADEASRMIGRHIASERIDRGRRT